MTTLGDATARPVGSNSSVFGSAGASPWILAALLLTLALYAKSRDLVLDTSIGHVGISKAVPAAPTYLLLMLALAPVLVVYMFGVGQQRKTIPRAALVFALGICAALLLVWEGTNEQISGTLQLLTGLYAWSVGAFFAARAFRTPRGVQIVAGTMLFIVAVEIAVCLAQVAGVAINPMPPDVQLQMGDRVNGTAVHPGNLGKEMVLLIVLSLGLLSTTDHRARRLLVATVGGAFIPIALSQGRANALAAVSILVLWAILSSDRRTLNVRVALPLVMFLVAAPFFSTFAARMQEDPEGGPRAHLSEVAERQIAERPLSGTGPNAFVTVVSPYDPIVAEGYPVHNSYYLTAAELGIPLAVLFWTPLAWLIVLSWRRRKAPGFAGSFAVAVLASVPGFFVITFTGWAMLSDAMLPFWFLIMGIAYWAVSQPQARSTSVTPQQSSLA